MDGHRWSRGAGGELCEVCGVRRMEGPLSFRWHGTTWHQHDSCHYYTAPGGVLAYADDCPPCEKRAEGAAS